MKNPVVSRKREFHLSGLRKGSSTNDAKQLSKFSIPLCNKANRMPPLHIHWGLGIRIVRIPRPRLVLRYPNCLDNPVPCLGIQTWVKKLSKTES